MNKIACLLILGLVTCACTPQPYVRFKTPNINGTLQINSAPAQGALILLSLDAGDTECLKAVQRTRTNENGEFVLTAEKEHMDYTPLMTHYLDEWTICAEIQGIRRTLYGNNRYGMGSVPHGITLNCKFNTQAKNDNPCQQPVHD